EGVPAAAAVTPASKVSVTVSAPKKLEVGKKEIVRVEVKNTSLSRRKSVRVTVSFPKSIVPVRDTDGAPFDKDGLHYVIEEMVAGGTVLKQIEFEGVAADAAAVVKARLTADQVPAQSSEAAISVTSTIKPPGTPGSGIPGGIEAPANAGNLVVTAVAANEPITVGGQVTYRIDLKNQSPQPDDDVSI